MYAPTVDADGNERGGVPVALLDQLAMNGVMVIPVGISTSDQILLRIRKTPEGIQTKHLLPVRFVPLVPGA